MRLIADSMEEMERQGRRNVTLVMGTFDGMHLGHAALCKVARRIGGYTVLHTFMRHPREVVSGKHIPLLSTPDERVCLAARMGMREMRMMHFDSTVASISAQEYLDYIARSLAPRHIVIGFNHTFGRFGQGDAVFLRENALKYGYRLHIVPPMRLDGALIAASSIRDCIEKGEMEGAAHLLGRPYSVGGSIVHGRQIGGSIGFPTANIHPPDKLIPPFGVYAALVELKGGCFQAVLNIGTRPTVNGHHMTIEAHLLDFEGNIYGKYARAHLLKFLRPEVKFDTMAMLKEHIAQDIADTRRFFADK